MARRTKKNLHVPLDEQLHARLVAQAQRVRAPVTTVAREAIEAWTAEAERRALQDAMRAYAEAMAASGADLAPRSGSEQRGRRPVVVMSSDAFNAVPTWRSVVVVPLTTSERQLRVGPSAIAVPAHAAQLPSASVALCHQITTLDRAKLVEALGVLPANVLREVERGVMAALDVTAAT